MIPKGYSTKSGLSTWSKAFWNFAVRRPDGVDRSSELTDAALTALDLDLDDLDEDLFEEP